MRAQVLIEKGKHGDLWYDASTPEKWAAACVAILANRLGMGYFYKPTWPPYGLTEEQITTADMAGDKLEALDPILRAVVDKLKQQVKSARQQYNADLEEWTEVNRIVRERDVSLITIGREPRTRRQPRAWDILQNRSGYEYEGVELEGLIDATEQG